MSPPPSDEQTSVLPDDSEPISSGMPTSLISKKPHLGSLPADASASLDVSVDDEDLLLVSIQDYTWHVHSLCTLDVSPKLSFLWILLPNFK